MLRLSLRRLWQFSLRGLLLLTLVAAAFFGWLRLGIERAKQQKEAADAITSLGGTLTYEGSNRLGQPPKLDQPAWLINLLGEDYFLEITGVTFVARPYVRYQRGQRIDPKLDSLAMLRDLRDLKLSGINIRDEAVEHFQELHQLQTLELDGTAISNVGLVGISQLTELETLDLSGTDVTDDGVESLVKLQKLKVLYLLDTSVTDQGVESLRTTLPAAKIYHRRWRTSAEPYP